jgi:hypothetical protein
MYSSASRKRLADFRWGFECKIRLSPGHPLLKDIDSYWKLDSSRTLVLDCAWSCG